MKTIEDIVIILNSFVFLFSLLKIYNKSIIFKELREGRRQTTICSTPKSSSLSRKKIFIISKIRFSKIFIVLE